MGDSVLQKSILETKELVLSYQDNVFSLEFAALNYRSPEQNRYKYKMEGFEQDWHEVDSTRRFATYTNLDPGDYVFRVIASNNDGRLERRRSLDNHHRDPALVGNGVVQRSVWCFCSLALFMSFIAYR